MFHVKHGFLYNLIFYFNFRSFLSTLIINFKNITLRLCDYLKNKTLKQVEIIKNI